jgi:hypothetical protein
LITGALIGSVWIAFRWWEKIEWKNRLISVICDVDETARLLFQAFTSLPHRL